jgi:hypothetical protein
MPEKIIESIEELKADPDNPTYESPATRHHQLRQTQPVEAADSVEFRKQLLEVAKDVVAADRDMAESHRRPRRWARTDYVVNRLQRSRGGSISPADETRQTSILRRLRSNPACNMVAGLLGLASR